MSNPFEAFITSIFYTGSAWYLLVVIDINNLKRVKKEILYIFKCYILLNLNKGNRIFPLFMVYLRNLIFVLV